MTGATGFVGSRLVRVLVESGERVKVLVRPGSSLRALQGLDVEIAEGDILIEHTVYRALAGCTRLYHCAAVYALWAPDPAVILQGARLGTEAVLRAAVARGIERVVYTSTAYTIGSSTEPAALDENAPWVEPPGPVYAIAKRRAEEWALEYAYKTRLPLVVTNPCAIFGPGDWKPTPTGDGVLAVLRAPALPGVGTLVPAVPGGLNVVDVDDVVRGHILAMQKGRVGERYILGGENFTLQELFATIATLAGRPVPRLTVGKSVALATGALLSTLARITGNPPAVSYDVVRSSFGRYYWVNDARARRELGYTSRPARQALARSVRYYVDHGYLTPAQLRRIRLNPVAIAATS